MNSRDRDFVAGLIGKLAEWVPHPADEMPAEVPAVLRPAAIGRGA